MFADRDHAETAHACPHAAYREDRKSTSASGMSGEVALERISKDVVRIGSIDMARQILRGEGLRQAGFMAELANRLTGARVPVLFAEGEAHRKQRSATARFFAPKVVSTRYRQLMVEQSRRLLDGLRRDKRANLAAMSMELSVVVTAEIVGLTDSDQIGLTERLNSFLNDNHYQNASKLMTFVKFILSSCRMLTFFFYDVSPAIKARRAARQEDIISHLLDQNYSAREILTECITYGAAGIATTRELIVMAAWHLFDRPDLKDRFLKTDETGRIAILEEVLRLEPVVGVLYRRVEEKLSLDNKGRMEEMPKGTLLAIDVRAVNSDPAAAGICPHRLDPDRQKENSKWPDSLMSFGDGPHRCPGATVALQESAVFLDQLFRIPGLRLERPPTMTSNPLIESYELHDAIITCN